MKLSYETAAVKIFGLCIFLVYLNNQLTKINTDTDKILITMFIMFIF